LIPSFQCQRCGNCCRHEGEVRLDDGEADAIARELELDVATFTDRFTLLRDDRRGLSLKELPDGSCIFLEGTPPACQIQTAKPRQCRDFPMKWKYRNLKAICPGAAALQEK
jgi:Fe-S-cluster containining protein